LKSRVQHLSGALESLFSRATFPVGARFPRDWDATADRAQLHPQVVGGWLAGSTRLPCYTSSIA